MQIDRYTHLRFPAEQHTNTATDDTTRSGVADAVRSSLALSAVPKTPAQAQSSAMLHLGAGSDETAVYSRSRKVGFEASEQADMQRMAQRYHDAMVRQGPDARALTVDKDGVLVAKPRTAFSTQESDFVALAVSAMRDFRDTADRAKVAGNTMAAPPPMAASGLRGGLAQLAARFKASA